MDKKKKYLFFDLDDTLVKCSGYYYDVEDKIIYKYLEYTNKYTFSEIKEMFNEKQFSNIQKHGYGPDNFKYSLMQIGSEIVGYDFFKDNLSELILKEAQILYDSPLELIDGAEETIKYLYEKGYEMYIITKGADHVQTARLNRLPIKKYFSDYYIVKHKVKEDYENILQNHKLNPSDCYMIGNSPKGDINEAKYAGLNTIYIPNECTWGPETEKISDLMPKTFELENIKNIMEIL